MEIKKFDNGHFAVRREESYDSPLENGLELIYDLCNSIELDFDIAGEEGCAGNFDMYYPLYNAYTDKMYLVLGADCERYRRGEEVTLYAREPDTEMIQTYYAERGM